jgi:glutamate-ammonia-ligase adenylyltransferase
VLACDILHGEPDPDMALNNWERFVSALEMPDAHFKMLLSQPQRLRILLSIFSRSQFLAESLIQHPDLLDWITSADVLNPPRRKEDISSELRELALQIPDRTAWCDALRRLRRREILRIGTRDICLKKPVEIITGELSDLADVIIDAALRHAWQRMRPQQETADNGFAAPNGLCIFAMGKLGGRELNYSSDIDLVSGYEKTPETQDDALTRFSRLMRAVRADLSDHTGEGCAYRVDLRLRPYGSSGAMVSSFEQFRTYYTGKAAAWEIQALLKCRPVAGDLQAGRPWISEAGRLIAQPRDPAAVYDAIRKMRDASVQQQQSRITAGIDVKTGIGGLRDIEFLVQGLQLIHAHSAPDILTGHTLTGLERLRKKHFLAAQAAAELSGHYRFMRRIEHCLQIMEDQQIHALPQDARELTALARRVMDNQTKGAEFLEQLDACRKTVRAYYREYMDNSP